MGFMDEYNKLKKKRQEEQPASSKESSSGSFMDEYNKLKSQRVSTPQKDLGAALYDGYDYSPVLMRVNDRKTTKKDEDKGLDFFQKGVFEDGYNFGDVTKAILGTAGDAGLNVVKGVASLGEGIGDAISYGIADVADVFGNDDYANRVRKNTQENTIDSLLKGTEDYLDKYSILGRTSDSIMQGIGQVGGIMAVGAIGGAAGLGAAGTTALTTGTMGLSGIGSGTSEAYQAGATEDEARVYGLVSGAADALSEMIFGGLGKAVNAVGLSRGLTSADDMLAKKVSSMFSNQIMKNISEFGIKAGAEGLEEVVAGIAQAAGKKATYMSEKEWGKILEDENLLEQFVVGAVTSGFAQAPGLHIANKTKTDFITGQSQNEQAVIKKEIENRIAAAEKDGKKLTAQEKSAIEAQVEKDLEKGYISTDTIEEVLGGESYSAYNDLMKESEEFNTLYKTEGGKLSEEQRDRLAELKEKNKVNPYQTQIQTAKEKLSQDVFGIAKGDRLVESYNERARRGQAFEADLSKYDKKQQQTIQNAINSGLLNNTNRTHELVDFIAKISADKGVLFDFTNNEKIKGTQFAVEGKIVNGYVTESGVTLNVESPKYLNTTVGHEITHVLEGTEFYDTLRETIFNYAIAKDGQDAFNARLKEIEILYKGMKDTTAEAELTADLVGEYLFTDSEFIQRLSMENRNVFQKIFDEIKYLCRVATAGSKEARELERVKKAFEDAYRADSKQTNTQHSLSDNTGRQLTTGQQEYFKDSKMRDDNGNLMVMYHGSQDAGFHVFDARMSDDDTSFFFVDRNDVAASYSGTTETYEAKTIRTAEDMNNFLADIGYDQYEAIEQDGRFELLEDGDHVAYSDTAQGLYEEFCWYEGVGNGDANYKVYLNLKNPLEVDAQGRPWNKIDAEFSQEVYDRFQSLTDDEKAALIDIAEWEDFRVFNSELQENYGEIYEKLGGDDANIYDIFSVASDNFSEESLRENSRKYLNTRDYAQRAKEQGYDGVIFKNIHDNGGYSNGSEGASTVAIAFDSNQIKSTANENPTADKDIRYSISEEQNQRGLNTEQEFQYSLSRDTEFSDNAIKKNEANKKSNHYSIDSEVLAEAKQLREAVAARMREIKEMGHVGMPEDTEGKTDIANSSYDVTEENTTICPRSLASEAFVDAVSEYLGRPLTVEEQIYISQDLLKPGRTLTPECTYCYVATDRKAYRAFLGEYINQRDAVLQKLKENPDADVSRSGELYKEFLKGRKDTNPMYKRFKMWADAYKNGRPMVEASHLANMEKLMGDIKSEFGAELKPQIVDAMKYAQSASWAKKRVSYVAYNGHILKWKQDRINKLNSHYGLRMYSFSDFHPAFVLENMQMITDASVRGLKMLGYTKDTDFVEIFAPSGMNINISTFGGVRNGTVFEDSMMGANWQKAKALRMQYPNVGITFVATNDTMVEWALAQDWIDVVIPYHLVRTGEKVAAAFNYTNYTSESSDKKGKDWQKGKDEKYIAPTKHNNDLETYLNALADNHLEPRFARFIDNPNYMKLVNECRQSASESKPVQPKFNEDAINEVLAKLATNGYYQPIGGSVDRMYEIAAEVAESMTHQLAPAMSLSNIGDQPKTYGTYNVSGKDVALEVAPVAEAEAPVVETAAETPVAPVVQAEPEEDLFPDDLAPVQDELDELYQQKESLEGRMFEAINAEDVDALNQANIAYDAVMGRIEHLEKPDAERAASLEDADVPPEMEAPFTEESENYNPFGGITHDEITRSTRSYSDRNPGARHFFEEAALGFLYDVNNSTHGERWYNDDLYYRTGGEEGFGGTSRQTTDDIAELKDTYGYTWDELRKAAEAVADGDFRTVAAKRVEYLLNKRMLEGYTDVDGRRYEPNQDYISYLNETFANEQRTGSVDDLLENAGQYAPMEDIAPVAAPATETVNTDSKKGVIRGQETYITAEDKLNGRRPQEGTGDAPLYDSKEKSAVHGQQTMFEPPKPNPKVATVLTEETAIAKEKTGISGKLVSALVDKGMVFENLSLKTGNHELQAKWNYALGSNTEARAQHLMENGDTGVKSLKDIKTTVDKSGKADAFFNYLYHVHNIDRMTLDERFGVENKTVFGETVTADVSRKKAAQYEKANPEFKAWAEDVYAYNKHLRQLLVDGGVISQNTADLWEKMYPHYVPIRRVDAKGQNISVPLDTNKTGVNNPVKKATGGSSDIQPVFSTMAQRTEQTYRAIARNSFGIELKNTLGSTINSQQNTTSVDETIDTLVAQEDHLLKAGTMSSNPTFTVFENGERVEFEITEDMFDALKPARGILGHRNKAIGAVGNVRRNLLTTWNPVFALYRNPIKDMQDVAINSQHAVKTYLSVPKAIYEIATGGKWATEYHQNGGKSNTYFDSKTNQFKAEDNAFKKTIGMPIRAIETAGEFIEEIPRLAEYIASRQEGRSVERSMLDAARVTTNFAAGGDFTKFLNSHGFTFLNASVQGFSQHVRNFREAGMKGFTKVLAKYVIAGLPTILLNSMLWDDDEEYEELSDYVKQNYYVVAKTKEGKFVRIPKGRTAAVMGELMQQMENLVTGDDVADFNTFFELFMNNIAPSNPVENNILAPVIQAATNTAWYGGDLVPSRLQDLPAEEQFDESTDSISKWLGENFDPFDFGPYKINYLLDQYTGGLGDMVLPTLTPEAESGDNSFMGNVLAPWKKEITTDSVLNNKNPGDFYDLRDELKVKSNSRKATEEDKMRTLYMDSVSWDMSDLYAKKREIQGGDLPDDEKYEAVREIQEEINALARTAMEGYNNVSIDGIYSEVGDRRYNYSSDKGKWYEITPENADGTANWFYQQEQKVTKAFGISYEEYWNNREEYNYAYDKPGKYAIAKAVGGYDSYMEHYDVLENWQSDSYLAADKDSKGNSISGSRKEKVIDYINGLDADYGEKIILYRTVYSSKADKKAYNMEIINYLNSRDDISYQQMKSILEELDMEVDSKGNITW